MRFKQAALVLQLICALPRLQSLQLEAVYFQREYTPSSKIYPPPPHLTVMHLLTHSTHDLLDWLVSHHTVPLCSELYLMPMMHTKLAVIGRYIRTTGAVLQHLHLHFRYGGITAGTHFDL